MYRNRFEIRLELDKFLTSKITKRHIRLYGEYLIYRIIFSNNFETFKTNYGHLYKKVKYNTFYDIKLAYFKWTRELWEEK